MTLTINRRGLLAGTLMLAAATALPPPAFAAGRAPAFETVDLQVSATRATRLMIWRPRHVRGVALLSTGQGSWPERYAPLLVQLLVAHGLAVLAPVHVDSMHYADREKFGPQAGFFERIADLRATSKQAAALFPGKPVIAVGHSYGSLMALGLGGALSYINMRDPLVKAALCFSSPGKIPQLIQPKAYATLAVPTMLITGTADTVPEFVVDPANHLFPIESAPPGARFAFVVAGADHRLVADPASFAHVRKLVSDFLEAYAFDDAAARSRLARFRPAAGDRFIDRERAGLGGVEQGKAA